MNLSGIDVADEHFGVSKQGDEVRRWRISDGEVTVGVLDRGAVIHSLEVPDGSGTSDDVVLGFDDVAGYETSRTFAGAVVGRFANRLTGARFALDGVEYAIVPNEGPTALHGGLEGFHTRMWSVAHHSDGAASGLRLHLVSPDGDQGFPGRLEVTVDYLLVPGERRLRIDYAARTDAPTVVNLTQHAYFNLAGSRPVGRASSPALDGHRLRVDAAHYTPVDAHGLPSGEVAHTVGTAFDLREPRPLDFLSMDHNLVLGDGRPVPAGQPLRHAATLEHAGTGRRLDVHSTEPGLQVYTGIGLDGSEVGKGGVAYERGAAVCLETQHFPDSPNQPAFPSTTLRPGELFASRTEWVFGTL